MRLHPLHFSLGLVSLLAACTEPDVSPGNEGGAPNAAGAPGVDPSECEVVQTDCSQPQALTNADLEGGATLKENTCYTASSGLTVNSGTVTLEKGVVIQFPTKGSLNVGSEGQLHIAGTCEHPVRLKAKDSVSTWRGVRMENSQGEKNSFTYTQIERAGDSAWTGDNRSGAALSLIGTTNLDMDHVTISESQSTGLWATQDVKMSFTQGKLSGNQIPAWLDPRLVSAIAEDVVLEDNENPFIYVVFSNNDTLTGAHTWAGLPLLIKNRFYIDGDLTIQAGAELSFEQDVPLIINAGGTLTAEGSEGSPVAFFGAAKTQGFWKGIEVNSGGVGDPATVGLTLNHAVVSHAGSTAWTGSPEHRAAIFVGYNTSGVSIKNTKIEESGYYAIYVGSKGRLVQFESNTFEKNARVASLHPDRVGELGEGHQFSDNTEEFIRVSHGNTNKVTKDASWIDHGIPYLLQDWVGVAAELSIEEGVEIRVHQNKGMEVDSAGSLSIQGSAEKPVLLRGAEEVDTGYWRGIRYISNDPKNTVTHAQVLHSGASAWTGNTSSKAAFYLESLASLSLTDVEIGPGGGHGIFIQSSHNLTCSDVAFTSLESGNVYHNSSSPQVLSSCPD